MNKEVESSSAGQSALVSLFRPRSLYIIYYHILYSQWAAVGWMMDVLISAFWLEVSDMNIWVRKGLWLLMIWALKDKLSFITKNNIKYRRISIFKWFVSGRRHLVSTPIFGLVRWFKKYLQSCCLSDNLLKCSSWFSEKTPECINWHGNTSNHNKNSWITRNHNHTRKKRRKFDRKTEEFWLAEE